MLRLTNDGSQLMIAGGQELTTQLLHRDGDDPARAHGSCASVERNGFTWLGDELVRASEYDRSAH
jgi:hypothetical protein